MAENAFPFNLLKANLELHLRLAQLLQEDGQRWLEQSSQIGREGLDEYKTAIDNLAQAQNWQAFLTVPAEAYWRQVHHRFSHAQNAAQLAIETQATLTRGLQQAVQSWQKSAIGNLDAAAVKLPFLDVFKSGGANRAPAAAGNKQGAHHGG
ncbi:hypothetical protein CAL29_13225 [Bordetella genomosp. 10]|uniref:Phasin domain-containing protein n=1 Tax=Bordetella genomosp. 10 TaxID=1416804 RepID=A0A261SAP7_9BORD|nr:phasin family protein [Bordetella genomosp. 10]OZI34469.1 hypothetical protein CAL29_13225 [Bordetella genomosp. 10]